MGSSTWCSMRRTALRHRLARPSSFEGFGGYRGVVLLDPRFIDERHDANPREHAVDLVGDMPTMEDEDVIRADDPRSVGGPDHPIRSDHPTGLITQLGLITRQPPTPAIQWRGSSLDGRRQGEDVPDVEPTGEGGDRRQGSGRSGGGVCEEPRGKAAVAAAKRAEGATKRPRRRRRRGRRGGGHPGAGRGRCAPRRRPEPRGRRDAALVASVRSKAPRSSPIVEAPPRGGVRPLRLKCIALARPRSCATVLRYLRRSCGHRRGHLADLAARTGAGTLRVDRRGGGALGGAPGVAAAPSWASTWATSTAPPPRVPGHRGVVSSSRGGRAGGEAALGVYVASDGPLDRHGGIPLGPRGD